MFDGISPNHRIFGSMFDQAKTSVARTAQEEEDARERMETCVASLPLKNGLLLRNEEGIWKLCRTFALKFFGSMFDAKAIHAQIPSNIEPNYHLNDVLGMLKVQVWILIARSWIAGLRHLVLQISLPRRLLMQGIFQILLRGRPRVRLWCNSNSHVSPLFSS